MIFAGPGSPTYAISHWRGSAVWDEVIQRFEDGADLFFASAASITLGCHALPVYEVYKAGQDPFWAEGLDVLGKIGLRLAVVPHFNDKSGGENYDSRFCYMGARRFDALQEELPPDVAIVGIDAYTSIFFDPAEGTASVSGQGGITLISDGTERVFTAGSVIPFESFHSSERGVVRTFDQEQAKQYNYAFAESESTDPFAPLTEMLETSTALSPADKVELLARVQAARSSAGQPASTAEGPLVDLVLELREALRLQKLFQLSDKARKVLEDLGFEIGDTAEGATWTRR
jgi:hypothetical protein